MIKKPVTFYSNNFLKYAAPLSCAFPAGLEAVFDNDRRTAWRYEEANSVTLDFAVKSYDGQDARHSFDTLILKNHNLESVQAFYQNPDGSFSQAFSVAGIAGEDIIYTAPQKSNSGGIRLVLTAMAGQSAVIVGTLGLLDKILELFALTDAELTPARGAGSFRTYNGSVVHWVLYRKKDINISVQNATKGQFDALYAHINDTQELFISLWDDYDVLDAYEMYVDPEFSFTPDRRTELISFKLKAQEL